MAEHVRISELVQPIQEARILWCDQRMVARIRERNARILCYARYCRTSGALQRETIE